MNITDPKFKYVPSNETDIRKRFERIRREERKRNKATPTPAAIPIGRVRKASNRS